MQRGVRTLRRAGCVECAHAGDRAEDRVRSCARGSHRLAGAGASKRARGSGSADRGQCRLPPPPPPHPSAGPAQLEQRHLHPSRSPPAAVIQGPAIAAGPAYRRRWVRRGSNRLLHRRPVVALRLAVVQRLGLEGFEVLSHLLLEVRKRRRSDAVLEPPSLLLRSQSLLSLLLRFPSLLRPSLAKYPPSLSRAPRDGRASP